MVSWATELKGAVKRFTSDKKPSTNGAPTTNGVPPTNGVPSTNGGPSNNGMASSLTTTLADIPSGTNDESESHVLAALKAVKARNIDTLADVALHGIEGGPIDDKTYLMERIIQLTADLPLHDRISDSLTNSLLSQLWNDLDHPTKSALGSEYAFRRADGSNNNLLFPHIGKAGQPYARTVRPKRMQPSSRPDPGVVFDAVLARKEFRPHPNGISSVLFYLASVIIHDCFHTSHENFAVSQTSSYLDLAPLYGSNHEQQMSVRTLRDGKLKPDTFCDKRILGFPPGVGVFLIMFNRFHNHVVTNMAKIDEGGRFSSILHGHSGFKGSQDANGSMPTPVELYDEALFQTARLVTSALYVNIILKDYVRTILNLNRVDTLWNLDPRSDEGNALLGKKIPEAQGNQCSAEFNLVYRWHSCISERDARWTEEAFKTVGQGKALEGRELLEALKKWSAEIPEDPAARSVDNLQRQPDGTFSDDDLVRIWSDGVEDVAGSFGADHIPPVLRSVEVLGMIQSRAWKLATLNEFREHFNLLPHETFESINPDPRIAKQLEKLYGTPDDVEIYPGIVVEAAKKAMKPGSGLCASFTTSRAILADAVALVRSDRLHTVDMTPQNLTNWGFNAASCDLNINHGCVIYKLILNAFPHRYSKNSVYAHFPMVIPGENKIILKDLKRDHLYSFDRPATRTAAITRPSVMVGTTALNDASKFDTLWAKRASRFGATAGLSKSSVLFAEAVMKVDDWEKVTATYYTGALQCLWRQKQHELGGFQQVDVVGDVLNAAHIGFITDVLGIPLAKKDKKHSTHWSFLSLFGEIFEHAFGNPKPSNLRESDRHATHSLAEAIETHFRGSSKQGELGKQAFTTMAETCADAKAASWQEVLPTSALILNTLSRLSAQTIEFYLDDKVAKNAVKLTTNGTDTSIMAKYAREATRLISNITLAKKATAQVQLHEGSPENAIEPGQVVVVDIGKAHSEALENAAAFKLDRDDSIYSMKDFGPAVQLAYQVTYICNAAMLSILAGLPDVARVPGPQGRIKKIKDDSGNVMYMNAEESEYVPYPISLKLRWTDQNTAK